jgi:CRISPR-associated protein Cmr1
LPGRAALGWGDLLQAPPPEAESHPEIPTLTPRWWKGTVLEGQAGSLGEALHRAGLRWRRFRAADDDARGRKPSQTTHSPEWLNSIHGDDERYPIAAFGLPIGYFSSTTGFNATVTPELKGDKLRRASPVWLHPILLSSGRWGVFTHVFYARLLPNDAELRISTGTSTLSVPSDEVIEEGWDRWLDGDPRLPDGYFPRR